MLDNALTIALDGLVVPTGRPKTLPNNYLVENRFELVFDEELQGKELEDYRSQNVEVGNYGDDDDNYESCDEDDY